MTDSYNFFNLRAFSESDQPYACDDWVVFQEKAYKSRKPNNNRHPHDSEYWDEIGLVSGLLDHLLQDNRAIDLSVAFYPECSNGCVAMFHKGGCVIDKVPVFNEDGTQKKDDCGQLVFELMIFTSLVDCNTDAPQDGASKDDPTWDGGYTVCAYLNRPVAYTQDGNKPENWLKPEAPQNLKCVLDCSAPDGETIALAEQGEAGTHSSTEGRKLRARHDNESIITTPDKGLEVAVIGKTINSESVDVREEPCLVTCEDMGNGLWHNPETGRFEVKPADHSVTVDSEGIRVKISDGLELTDDGVKVKAADDSIGVTPEGVQVGVIGFNRAGDEINTQDEPCLVTCEEMGNGLSWNAETKQWDVVRNKDCTGNTIQVTDSIVACRNLDSRDFELVDGLIRTKPDTVWSDPGANFSGGICFSGYGAAGGAVLQGRDNTIVYGNSIPADYPLGYHKITVTNPFNEAAKLKAVMQIRNNIANGGGVPDGATVKFVHTLGEVLNVGFDGGGGSSSPIQTNWSWEEVEVNEIDFIHGWASYSQQTGSLFYERMLAPNETITLYGQWWIIFYQDGVYVLHPMMHTSYEITRRVAKVGSVDELVRV